MHDVITTVSLTLSNKDMSKCAQSPHTYLALCCALHAARARHALANGARLARARRRRRGRDGGEGADGDDDHQPAVLLLKLLLQRRDGDLAVCWLLRRCYCAWQLALSWARFNTTWQKARRMGAQAL